MSSSQISWLLAAGSCEKNLVSPGKAEIQFHQLFESSVSAAYTGTKWNYLKRSLLIEPWVEDTVKHY